MNWADRVSFVFSEYTVATLGGGCIKQLPTPSGFSQSTVCGEFGTAVDIGTVSTVHGSSLSVPFMTYVVESLTGSTYTIGQIASEYSLAPTDVVLIDEKPMIVMVHKPGEIKDGSSGSGSGSGSNSGNGNGNGNGNSNGSGKSAAAHQGPSLFGMVPFALAWATLFAAILA